MTTKITIDDLKLGLDRFARDRDWDKLHSPKNLAMVVSSEAAHVLEQLKWLTEEQSRAMSAERFAIVADELADVVNYVIRLCSVMQLDPIEIGWRKLKANEAKYPVDPSR